MTNYCKKKGCKNEALNGEKYCKYHQSQWEDTKKIVVGGASALATCVVAISSAILSKKANKK